MDSGSTVRRKGIEQVSPTCDGVSITPHKSEEVNELEITTYNFLRAGGRIRKIVYGECLTHLHAPKNSNCIQNNRR